MLLATHLDACGISIPNSLPDITIASIHGRIYVCLGDLTRKISAVVLRYKISGVYAV